MATTFDDLSEADQTKLLARLKVYGLDQTAITNPDLTVPGGSTVHLAAGDPKSAIPARMLTTKDVDELKTWIGLPDELYTSGRLDQKRIALPAELAPETAERVSVRPGEGTAGDPASLATERTANAYLATSAYLFGNSAAVANYKGVIGTVFPSFQVPIWPFITITVSAGGTLQLSGDVNVLVAWKIVIYDGGRIVASGGLTTSTEYLEKQASLTEPPGVLRAGANDTANIHVAPAIGDAK